MIKTLPSDCSSLTDLFKTSTVLQTFTLTQLNSCQGWFYGETGLFKGNHSFIEDRCQL